MDGAGGDGLGMLSAASSLGATTAVLLLAAIPGSVRREPLLAAVFLLYGLGLIAFAASPSPAVALVAVLVVGGCASAFDTLQQTLAQLVVPDERRGRAVGVWMFSLGTAPLATSRSAPSPAPLAPRPPSPPTGSSSSPAPWCSPPWLPLFAGSERPRLLTGVTQ